MADAKIEIKVGAVSFSGEGEGKWLSEQLDKVIEKLPQLANVAPFEPDNGGGSDAGGSSGSTKVKPQGNLAAFLKAKKATTNQVKKFLAAATWLQAAGKDRLTTMEVTKALSDAKQGSLTNPSQCLAHNVSQGFCEKDGKRLFFVTPEGNAELESK
jgi:hypothetical protein